MNKVCKNCGEIKIHCKELCKICYFKQYYKDNKDKIDQQGSVYYRSNVALINERTQKYYKENRTYLRELGRKYYQDNQVEINEYYKQRYRDNPVIAKQRAAIYEKERRLVDINYKLRKTLRSRIHEAMRNNQKVGSAIRDLGCTIDELRSYLESKFLPGMTWDNYGFHGWHMDHVTPLSYFDLTNIEQFKKACHYTNLQPLWAKDNLKKGNKLVSQDTTKDN